MHTDIQPIIDQLVAKLEETEAARVGEIAGLTEARTQAEQRASVAETSLANAESYHAQQMIDMRASLETSYRDNEVRLTARITELESLLDNLQRRFDGLNANIDQAQASV